MNIKIESSWKEALKEEFEKEYFKSLTDFVKQEYLSGKTIYPEPKNIFRAFDLCPFDKVKVVILGQDPYHGPKQANGLCFSVHNGISFPPSLQNIFKEMVADLNLQAPPSVGDLDNWARQGVFLLNATLTVRASQAGSHQKKGWEEFTDATIKKLSEARSNLVFILWGRYAQAKESLIDPNKHLILKAAHPSPLSAHNGFFGSKPFSKSNEYLNANGLKEINWADL